MRFNFKNAAVYSYHLKIVPEIPEDSRQLRQMIIKSLKEKIAEKLGGDYYTSGMIVFAQTKHEELISFDTRVNHIDFAISLNYDTKVDLNVFNSDDKAANKHPAL